MLDMAGIAYLVRQKWRFVVALSVLALLCSGRHAGFLAWLLILPVVLYQAVQALRYRRCAERRPQHLFALGVAIAAVLTIAAAHVYQHVASRTQADYIAVAVLDYAASHRRYPRDLAELADPRALPPTELKLRYSAQDKPALSYAATFVPFAVWVFDFERRVWDGPVD